MATFLEAQQRIADDLNRSDLTAQIKEAINRAIIYYEKEPFWFKETNGTFVTVASQQAYGTVDGIPSDIARIKRLETAVGTSVYDIVERDINYIRDVNPNSATGDPPTNYAWWQKKIYLSLVPSQVRTITAYYTKTYTELSADADTNDWLVYAEDLIEARARWWIYLRVIKNRKDADDAKIEEIDALGALREINEGYTAQGRIVPTSF